MLESPCECGIEPPGSISHGVRVSVFNVSNCLMNIEMFLSARIIFICTGKPTGKIPLGRPRRRWEDNNRMDLKEIGINTRDWVDSAQDRDCWRALVIAASSVRVS